MNIETLPSTCGSSRNIRSPKSYKQWLVLIAYCSLAFANNMGFTCYTPIWTEVAEYYNISETDLLWTTNMYYLPYVLFAGFTIKFVEDQFALSLKVSSVFTAAGAWTVWFAGQDFVVTMIGFIMIGISQLIYYAAAIHLGYLWFDIYDRTFAISIASYAQLAGQAVSQTFSQFYFSDVTETTEINNMIGTLNFIIAIVNGGSFVLCICLIPHKKYENQNIELELPGILDQFIEALNSEEHILDLVSIAVYVGIGWQYVTILSTQLSNLNFSPFEIGILGIVNQVSGISAGVFISYRLDRENQTFMHPNYDKYIKLTTGIGFLFLMFQILFIEYLNFEILLIFNIFIGIGLNTLLPTALQSYAEKLFPIKALLLNTLLNIVANSIAICLQYSMIVPILSEYGVWIVLVSITPFQLYITLFYKTKFNRFNFGI